MKSQMYTLQQSVVFNAMINRSTVNKACIIACNTYYICCKLLCMVSEDDWFEIEVDKVHVANET